MELSDLPRRWTLTAGAIAACLPLALMAAPTAQAVNPSCTVVFDPDNGAYIGGTPGNYVCDVAVGVTSIAYVVRGGYGGSQRRSTGGKGAKITGTLVVTPGETLTIVVGSNGSVATRSGSFGSYPGGSGGGYSAVARASSAVLVAGGGGGDGNEGDGFGGDAGAGTSASSAASSGLGGGDYAQGGGGATNGTGGAGGIETAEDSPRGGAGGSTGASGSNASADGGGGGAGGGGGFGSSTTGGTNGGVCTLYVSSITGKFGAGGGACVSGGGGGGYAGGGGGGGYSDTYAGGGGGGGSSLVPAGATAINTGTGADLDSRIQLVNASPAPVSNGVVVLNPTGGVTAEDGLRVKIGPGWRNIVRYDVSQVYSENGIWDPEDPEWNTFADDAPFNGVMLVVGNTVVCFSSLSSTSQCFLTKNPGANRTSLTQVVWDEAVTTLATDTTATTVMKKTLGGLLYQLTMTTTYTSPDNFATVTYSLVVPTGNTQHVRLYDGIDMYLDGSDEGPVAMGSYDGKIALTQFNASAIGGFREVASEDFSAAGFSYAGGYYACPFGGYGTQPTDPDECPLGEAPADTYGPYRGTDYPNALAAGEPDAAVAIAWDLGTPSSGTIVKAAELFFSANTPFTAAFDADSIAARSVVNLSYTLGNAAGLELSDMAFIVNLPTGAAATSGVVASPGNSCGGTATVNASLGTLTLSGGSFSSEDASCAITVPVSFAAGGSKALASSQVSSASAAGGTVITPNFSGELTVTDGTTPPAPGPAPAPAPTPTPTATATPTPTPTPTAAASSAALDVVPNGANPNIPAAGVPQGGSVFLVNGVPTPLSVTPNASRGATALDVSGPGFTMKLAGLGDDANPLGLTPKSGLILQSQQSAQRAGDLRLRSARFAKCEIREPLAVSSGTGFKANSPVKMYILPSTYIGTLTTDGLGNYSGSLPVPVGLKVGDQTLQANGFAPSGSVRSLSLGILVKPGRTSATKAQSAQVFFDPLSPAISAAGKAALNALVSRTMKAGARTAVVGFVQESAGDANDQSLSMQRARAVAAYLRKRGLTGAYAVRGDGVAGSGAEARRVNVTVRYQSGC